MSFSTFLFILNQYLLKKVKKIVANNYLQLLRIYWNVDWLF